jgi:hypothetical protein
LTSQIASAVGGSSRRSIRDSRRMQRARQTAGMNARRTTARCCRCPGGQSNRASPAEAGAVRPAMGKPSAAKSDPALANRSSGRRGGGPGALSHKLAANVRARALAPVIQELRAAGFISYNAVSRELNRRQVPTLRRGKQWYPTTVSRLLVRLARLRF